jgi:LPS-assembly protein
LKHRIWPSITYEYRSPQDDNEFQPWFEAVDQDGKINEVTLSLENFLDARLEDGKGNVTYRQWATFDLSQSYNIDEERRRENPEIPRQPFGPLSADLTITPFNQLDLRGSADWDHYESGVTTADLALDLYINRAGGKQDTFTVDYLYEKNGTKSLGLYANVNLAYGFSVGSSLQRSLDEDRNISNNYWLEYERQCWGIRFEMSRAERDTSFMVVFRLFGLGDISL